MKRILHIMNGAVSGGISKVVLTICESLKYDDVVYDCAVYNGQLGTNGRYLEKLGCNFFVLPLKSRYPIRYMRQLRKILAEGQYDVVHVHYNDTSYYPLFIAKFAGVNIRIAHAHTNRSGRGLKYMAISRLRHLLIRVSATTLAACSKEAAISVFGKSASEKAVLINNSINVEVFRFNEETRVSLRDSLGLGSRLVLGCVGNLGEEKNVSFAIQVLNRLIKQGIDASLVLVGDGPEKERLETMCRSLGIKENVLFLGRCSDVQRYLNVFDVFLMPSLYEGFGFAALEAICSGLPALLSTNIPRDFSFYPFVYYLRLEDGPESWAEAIAHANRTHNRKDAADIVRRNGYDKSALRSCIQKLYSLS
ncbi:glycosyltransferase [Adlercreutzia sp. ZJ141]|uniref:glycosyltransferase n=1 Tax=Adlercreutzia sp. ZJ141 TaxID=2709406 RepID=UPI0013EC1793|nr:glycosyltransferase [Adlercreutzia sp. ZJ141]